MQEKQLVSIFIGRKVGDPMKAVNQVRAVPGRGLEGDRYFEQARTFSKKPDPSREVTLIEIEALEALERDYGLRLEPQESRRNLVTQATSLNHLVGKEFQVGPVTMRGLRLCEPCTHLEKLAQKGVRPGLVHRGGLRAQILTEGLLTVGDPIDY